MSRTARVQQVASKGLTLLETLITVVLITMGLLPLILSFARGVFASNIASDLRVATGLTQAKMEELKNTSFASITSESRAALSGFTGFERAVSVTSAPGSTNSNFKQVVVTVYWRTKGGELSTDLNNYFVNN